MDQAIRLYRVKTKISLLFLLLFFLTKCHFPPGAIEGAWVFIGQHAANSETVVGATGTCETGQQQPVAYSCCKLQQCTSTERG